MAVVVPWRWWPGWPPGCCCPDRPTRDAARRRRAARLPSDQGRRAIADEQQTGLGLAARPRLAAGRRGGARRRRRAGAGQPGRPGDGAAAYRRHARLDRRASADPYPRRPGPAHRRAARGRAGPAPGPRQRGRDPLGVHLRAMALGRRLRRGRGGRRHRVAPAGPGPPRLRGQRQPRAEDPDRRAATARRGPAGRHRAGRRRAPDRSEDLVAARRFAERIQHESTRLGRLVQELLELSRLQGAEPLPDAGAGRGGLGRRRGASTGPAPPPPRRGHRVVVDGQRGPDRVRQRQPARHRGGQPGGERDRLLAARTPRSRVDRSRGDDDQVEIAVADQGIGIAPHDLDRIFERFYRADQARSRATGGTGLGLAIVKHIAINHGGRVEVSSTLGGGSTFTLRLPAQPTGRRAAATAVG